VAGVLAVIEAIVLARVPFEPFTRASDYRLISYAANSEQLFIDAAVVLAAGVCLLIPRLSRLVGTGLILGATAVLPSDIALVIAVQRVEQPAAPGPGGWLVLSAQVLGLTAAILAGLALWRGRAVRFEPRALADPRRRQLAAWLVVLLGVAGAIAYVIQVARASYVPGLSPYITSQLTVPLIWLTFVAVAIPLAAAAARPRVFGTALAGGWIGAGLGEAAFLTGFTTSVFSYTLVALALVLIPFGRSVPPPGRPRAARSGPRLSRR
jgi:hypothetical protein